MTLEQVAERLRSEGLIVRDDRKGDGLWIASTTYKAGHLEFTQNLTLLNFREGCWRIQHQGFPPANYEITGELDYLCDLIVEAYREHRKLGTFVGMAWNEVRHNHGLPIATLTLEPALAP